MTTGEAVQHSEHRSDEGVPAACGVVGGGRMGAGIAHALLLAGARVHVVERDEAAARAAADSVAAALAESQRRGVELSLPDAVARLSVSTETRDLAGSGLVVEAVLEDRALKTDVLRAVEGAVAADAVIATNTSSISIDELSGVLDAPERFVGLHFFNPVPASRLVEIVVGSATARRLVDRARGWVGALGKTPIVVADRPGFASSRLGVAQGLEAIRMLEEGVGTAEDIDTAMRLGYGHPMGPLRLTDVVGLDVRLGVARYLQSHLGGRFAPPRLLIEKVERGELGRKSGQGFYTW